MIIVILLIWNGQDLNLVWMGIYHHNFAPQSKNAVSTNIKHSRYIHLMSNCSSIHFHTKKLYLHMFDAVDTPFSYGKGFIVCASLQEFSKTKESTLHVTWNVDTAFLLCGADMDDCMGFPPCFESRGERGGSELAVVWTCVLSMF